MLASGFTSAISFGSTYKIDVALARRDQRGTNRRPATVGRGSRSRRNGEQRRRTGRPEPDRRRPWRLRKAVREQRKLRVDIVKIFIDGEAINPINPPGELSFCDEEVAAVVDEAHRRKLRVACHARSAAAVKQAVRAGVDYHRPRELSRRRGRGVARGTSRSRLRRPGDRVGSSVRRAMRKPRHFESHGAQTRL